MGLHTELPVYRDACKLFSAITGLVENMPRNHKAIIGSRIIDECVEVVSLIFRANVSRDKEPHLLSMLEHLQMAECYLRLSRDRTAISIQNYAKMIEITTGIGKQVSGWRKRSAASVS
jgi:hypothetical protein